MGARHRRDAAGAGRERPARRGCACRSTAACAPAATCSSAALLGAEEFAFSTAPLIAAGCIMMRVCHLNTCPVGIATQDPELRRRFAGTPEQIVHVLPVRRRGAARDPGLARRCARSTRRSAAPTCCASAAAEPARPVRADRSRSRAARARPTRCAFLTSRIRPTRASTACCSRRPRARSSTASRSSFEAAIAQHRPRRRHASSRARSHAARDARGSRPARSRCGCAGSAGQSFGAFAIRGLELHLEGQTNDYVGKGLSGALLAVRPHAQAAYDTSDERDHRQHRACTAPPSARPTSPGGAGERFCVRNSGATAVVEGVGDHGCEYMTGGTVAVLGPIGRNFAAGMSGGLAYIYDPDGMASRRVNTDLVALEPVTDDSELRELVERHLRADRLDGRRARCSTAGSESLASFVHVMPNDMRRILAELDPELALQETRG